MHAEVRANNAGNDHQNTTEAPYDPTRVANAPSNYGRFIVA